MAYVPIPYPAVLYSATGVPQPVANAAAAAALPASYAAVPNVAQAIAPGGQADPNMNLTAAAPAEEVIADQAIVLMQTAGTPLQSVGPSGPQPLLI